MKKQSGYTVVDLVIAVTGIISVALVTGAVIIAVHFIMKFW